jgi:ribonuclease HI
MADRSPIVMYTDGACSGNPGPGGWGAVLIEDGREIELSGGENPTTNQRMELTAPLEGLRSLAGRRRVAIYSDSAYVIYCFRDRWYESWRKNGWIGTS